jgi:hypothetical protein
MCRSLGKEEEIIFSLLQGRMGGSTTTDEEDGEDAGMRDDVLIFRDIEFWQTRGRTLVSTSKCSKGGHMEVA